MGHIEHDVIIAVFDAGRYEHEAAMAELRRFRNNVRDRAFKALIVGPIPAVTNGYITYAFMPVGSKWGWEDYKTGETLREKFKEITDCADVISVTYGADSTHEPGYPIVRTNTSEDED